jgi:Uma2 family endonuclease
VADNGTVRLDADNEPQPDALMYRLRSAGGQAEVDSDGYLTGAPDLVVEIAASSASHDLGAKMRVYERNGVREYVVWQILEERIDWFQLVDGRFAPMPAARDSVYESSVFPGLALDAAAMIAGDLNAAVAPMESA